MLNSTNGQQIATAPIGEGAGVCTCQSSTHTVYVLTPDGNLTIDHEDSPDKLTVVHTLETASGARALAVDSKAGKIFVGATGKILVYGSTQ